MNRDEFLNGLQNILAQELPQSEIESNIRFYDEYIRTKSQEKEERLVMEELGDPRLIGKTIIEAYQVAHGYTASNQRETGYYEEDSRYADEETNYGRDTRGFNININSGLKWYHKLLMFLILFIIISVVIVVGGILIRIFFSIGIPLLFIYMIYLMIRGNFRR